MRSSNKDELVPVGKITGAHGIKGEVKVVPYEGAEDFTWQTVFIAAKGGQLEKDVKKARFHKGYYIVELESVPDRNSAEALSGCEVLIRSSELPELGEDEYYEYDLIGMDVRTYEAKDLGKVTGVISTGSNDVLQVEGPYGEVLIPAIEDSEIRIDAQKRLITVRLLEGLLPQETSAGMKK